MTEHVKINGIIPKTQYIADGILTTYQFPFAFFRANDIVVYFNDTKQPSDIYTVLGMRHNDGGSVTFENAPTAGTLITIMRHLNIERNTDFQEGGALRADTLNDEFDYQIACQQQIAENLNRSMVLPPYAVADNVNLTLPTPSAGKAIVWNSDGTNLENSAVAVNELENTLRGYRESAETAASIATAKAQIASDKADIATEKAAEATIAADNKANKDLDNLSDLGKKVISNLAAPSDYFVNMSSTTSYIAPANGWAFFQATSGINNGYVNIICNDNTNNYRQVATRNANGSQYAMLLMPCKKGDVVSCGRESNGTISENKFIYAQGEIQ